MNVEEGGPSYAGDAVIAVVAFWVVAAVVAPRQWITAPSAVHVASFVGVGLGIATWVITPPLGVWFVKRQLAGTREKEVANAPHR